MLGIMQPWPRLAPRTEATAALPNVFARNPRGLKLASLLQRESWTFFSLTRISTVKLVCLTMYIYRFIKFRTFKTSIHHLLSPLAGVLNPLPAVFRWQQVIAWTSGQFTAGRTHKLPSILTSAHNDLQAIFKSLTLSQTSRSLTVTSCKVMPHR